MEKLVNAAIEENPTAFKHEFETIMKSKIDALVDQERFEIAKSVRVDGEVEADSE